MTSARLLYKAAKFQAVVLCDTQFVLVFVVLIVKNYS